MIPVLAAIAPTVDRRNVACEFPLDPILRNSNINIIPHNFGTNPNHDRHHHLPPPPPPPPPAPENVQEQQQQQQAAAAAAAPQAPI